MAVLAILLPLLFGALTAYAQTCTTVQPVFELPLDATSTVYASTITTISSVDCDGCSLEVTTFRAIISGSTNPPQTTTITDPMTTSARFVCLPQNSAITTTSSTSLVSAPAVPIPTASPLPPVTPTIKSFIDELSTALLYTELLANGGNSEKLCSIINPSSLDEISGIAINGSAVQSEVCALGAIDFTTPGFGASVVSFNQQIVSYLTTALFAIQVAGNYAGGCNLETLCSEIEATLIDDIFINNIPNVGTEVKDYVCSAASASASRTPTPTSAPYPTATVNATASCTTPTGFANTFVPTPPALATSTFQIAPSFASAHTLFIIDNLDARFSEATVASFCSDECIAYQPNSTTGPCLSFNVYLGKPVPPTGTAGPTQWFCSGFDAYLAEDGSDYEAVDTPGSFMYGIGVNRVCGGTYRAY